MNYRSIAQLSDQLCSWSATLPRDLDLIVGIPRSGLLVANLVALYRNLPMTDVEGLLEGRILASGGRYRGALKEGIGGEAPRRLKVLVIDDSVWIGTTIRETRERIERADLPHEILYATVYMRPGYEEQVDFYCESLDWPRVFEWNIMHHAMLPKSCLDIDGVLCADPGPGENDDGPRYREFLSCAAPLHLPSRKVGWLVTSRLEKYRELTEQWLAEQGVEYGELIMMDFPDKEARRAARLYSEFKADVYRRTQAKLFLESSLPQAIQIANIALKPVFCVDTRQMIYPGSTPLQRNGSYPKSRNRVAAMQKRVRKALSRLGIL